MSDKISSLSSKELVSSKETPSSSTHFSQESLQQHEMKKREILQNHSIFNLNANQAAAFIS